jgi:uncharacterized protein YyaL (SSP411 family)
MKVKYLNGLIIFITFSTCNISKAQQGIYFESGSWTEIKELAYEEGKLIFVDAYAEWCGPCKKMARHVFTDVEVGKFYNDNFINVQMDMEREGVRFAYKWGIEAYPTFLFLSPNGNILYKTTGARGAYDFLQLGKAVKKAWLKFDE